MPVSSSVLYVWHAPSTALCMQSMYRHEKLCSEPLFLVVVFKHSSTDCDEGCSAQVWSWYRTYLTVLYCCRPRLAPAMEYGPISNHTSPSIKDSGHLPCRTHAIVSKPVVMPHLHNKAQGLLGASQRLTEDGRSRHDVPDAFS